MNGKINRFAKKEKNKLKKQKYGIYCVSLGAVFIAVLVFFNLLLSSLPSKYTAIDVSSSGMYTLSDVSEEFLAGVNEDVTLYFVCSDGVEDERIGTFLGRYVSLNPHITLQVVDPVASPDVIARFTSDELGDHSVIVSGERRSKIIDSSKFYTYYNAWIGEKLTYSEFSQYYGYYGSYMSQYETKEYFEGESLVSCAIEYVLAQTVPEIYVTTGHGESSLNTDLASYLERNGVTVTSVSIASAGVPSNCSALIINAPQTDISESEADLIKKYLDSGGKVMLITAPESATLANLSSVCAHMGMAGIAGTVCETKSENLESGTNAIVPNVDESHSATELLASLLDYYGGALGISKAHAIKAIAADGVSVTSLLTTSDAAYTVNGDEKSDVGKFALAAVGEKIVDEKDGTTANLVWIASADMLKNGASYYNVFCPISFLAWQYSGFDSGLAVSSVDVTETSLSVTADEANLWGNVFSIALPVSVLVAGAAVTLLRRKRGNAGKAAYPSCFSRGAK